MTPHPRLSIGLPVYNGEEYLAESLDALLGQTYEDFELVISDNASTDATQDICRRYAALDPRIRYLRLPRNIGATPNHNRVFAECRGELFKWASHDDLYGRDLLRRCVEALDERPDVILAHSGQAVIDGDGRLKVPYEYGLATDSPCPPERFRSLLFEPGGDDFYGVMRADMLRRVKPLDSYHHADRTFVAEITLHGPFHQVPELLYFRRDHPTRAERANPSKRARCVNLDPRRAGPLHPTPRLLAEYMWGFVAAIRRAPLSPADRRACYSHLAAWMTSRVRPGAGERVEDRAPVDPAQLTVSVDALVAGREEAGMTSADETVVRVGVFGLLGSGNLGNDGSLEAVLGYLRTEHPEAVVDALCGGPEAVAARYGIPATRLHWYRGEYRTASRAGAIAAKGLGKLIDVFRTAAWVRRHDVVIVPGMGVLEATLPLRPWGFPYSLFLLCASGRLLRTRVALVSVGATAIGNRPTRALVRWSARLATYRSYRDTQSREAMRAMGVNTTRDEVYPDLAFALPTPLASTPSGPPGPVCVRSWTSTAATTTAPGQGDPPALPRRDDPVRPRAGRGGQACPAAHRRRLRCPGGRRDPRRGGLAAGHRCRAVLTGRPDEGDGGCRHRGGDPLPQPDLRAEDQHTDARPQLCAEERRAHGPDGARRVLPPGARGGRRPAARAVPGAGAAIGGAAADPRRAQPGRRPATRGTVRRLDRDSVPGG